MLSFYNDNLDSINLRNHDVFGYIMIHYTQLSYIICKIDDNRINKLDLYSIHLHFHHITHHLIGIRYKTSYDILSENPSTPNLTGIDEIISVSQY